LIHKRIKNLTQTGIIRRLNTSQVGFQEGLGCEINILKLITDAKLALEDW
jgi:hypothetical protein